MEERPQFPGSRSKFTEKLEFLEPDSYEGIPVYRVMNRKGEIINPGEDPQVSYVSFTTTPKFLFSFSMCSDCTSLFCFMIFNICLMLLT